MTSVFDIPDPTSNMGKNKAGEKNEKTNGHAEAVTNSTKQNSTSVCTWGNILGTNLFFTFFPSYIKLYLVTLYTVIMAVAVAAVITASQDLEVALKEKQTKLEQMEADLGSLKISHSQTTKEFNEKQTGFETKLNSLSEEKRKLEATLKDLENAKLKLASDNNKLLETIDKIEKIKSEKEKLIENLHLEMTEIKTKQFDSEIQTKAEQNRNTELTADNRKLGEKLAKTENNLKDTESRFLGLEKDKSEMMEKIKKGDAENIELTVANQKLEDKVIATETKLKEVISNNENLEKEKGEKVGKLDALSSTLAEKEKGISKLEEDIKSLNQELSEGNEKIASLTKAHLQDTAKLDAELAKERKLVQDQMENIRLLTEQIQKKQGDVNYANRELDKMKTQFEESERVGGELFVQNQDWQMKAGDLKREMERAQADAGNCLTERLEVTSRMTAEREVLERKNVETSEQLSAVTEQLNDLQSKLGSCKAGK